MLGAIIGDIVGSRFERDNYRKKDFDLFTHESRLTDDSVMTLAVAKALKETEREVKKSGRASMDEEHLDILKKNTIFFMQKIGRKYPRCGYGGLFRKWLFSDSPEPYNSYGNGAAMRISPVGFVAQTQEEVMAFSDAITGVSHNHPEAIKGARATALSVFLAKHGETKEEIKRRIVEEYYPIDFTIDEIRPFYTFSGACRETVPQALQCFFESNSFEDAIRTGVSLGGDTDTICAIIGGVAEAYYGIPEEIKNQALTYLDEYLLEIYEDVKTDEKRRRTSSSTSIL